MTTIKIGHIIERITGDKRDRGIVIEVDEAAQRARINWTHRQKYTNTWDGRRDHTVDWTGEFVEYTTVQPRT